MNEKSFKKEDFMKVFWIFLIGSIVGCIVETIVCLVQKGHFEIRQGLLYGPFIPVYGMGAVVYFFGISKIKGNGKIFLVSMLLGGITEYFFSYFQEKWFGTVSWDYSNLWFNLNGRTSLLHCVYWGIAGLLFVKLVYPYVNQGIDKWKQKNTFRCLTGLLTIFMFFNICISCVAANRQEERTKQIQPTSVLDQLLDRYYSDQVMDAVYSNKIVKISTKES